MEEIIFVGDIHGCFENFLERLEKYGISNSKIIQVGDFGIGFKNQEEDEKKLNNINNFLKKSNNHLYVIRGNHDNPFYFKGQHILSNLSLLEDYSFLEINGLNILFIGGAISIDRCVRMVNFNYFLDEEFKLEINKLNQIKNCDIVVTHSAPNEFYPAGFESYIVKNYIKLEEEKKGTNLLLDLIKEREDLSKVWGILRKNNNIKLWVYGHFHSSNKINFENTEIRLLNIDEFWQY